MNDHAQIIKNLELKVGKYEELLAEILQKRKMIGFIQAGPHNKLYRISGENNSTHLLPAEPNENIKFKIGDTVIFNENLVLELLPEELTIKKKITEFKKINWDQVGGMKSQIEKIRDAVEMPLKNANLYKELGVPPIKGILLWGPAGCGKTLIARVIASVILNETNTDDAEAFVYVKGPELLSTFVGQAEMRIRQLFESSRTYKKKTGHRSVIFIDEAEAILPKRNSRISSDVDTTIVPTFLAEMDGFEEGHPLVILSTNLPNNIDTAILRDGRIDLKIEVARPTLEDIPEIFEIHLSKTKVEGNIKTMSKKATKLLASLSTKNILSGAMIENLVHKAAHRAIKRKVSDKTCTSVIQLEDIQHSIAELTKNYETGAN